MTQSGNKMLDDGDAFPKTILKFTDGETLNLPEGAKGSWTIFLVYRGHW